MHVIFIVAPKTNTSYVYISKMQKRMDTRLKVNNYVLLIADDVLSVWGSY